METAFTLLRVTRKNLLDATNDLTLEQWNHIPSGFNNNIAWNFGHILVTQQILSYKLSGQNPVVSDQMINRFRKGTRPSEPISSDEIDNMRILMKSTVGQLEVDFKEGKLNDLKPYATSYGFEINSISEAVTFNNLHEGMHMGTILALKKLV